VTTLPPRPDGVSHLDAYLDGLMTPSERSAFEAAARSDPALREQVELQARVDSSLRAILPYDAPQPLRLERAPRAPRPWYTQRLAWLGMAAAVLLGVFLTVYLTKGPEHPRVPGDRLYTRLVKTGFVPEWKCETDAQFADAVQKRLGVPVVVPLATTGIEVLGWAYANNYDGSPLTEHAMILMVRSEGKNLLVLMDRAERDTGVQFGDECGLYIYRREFEGLVLYEITPFTAPRVLSEFRKP